MTTIKFGILGTANIAKKAVIPAIKDAENAEVVAVASGSGKAKEFAKELEIPHSFESYEELLEDESIDAVYIPLPNTLHKEWTIKAAKKGKHVLCEKPAAVTAEDAVEMVRACEDNNVVFMEAFMYQFHPQHQKARDIIASGEIGEVKLMRSTFSFDLSGRTGNIRLNKELGGGSMYDVGCYCIHSSRMILGSEPVKVYVTGDVPQDVGVDVSANAIMKMGNGVVASFDSSFELPMIDKYEVVGTKGSIQVPYAYRPDRPGVESVVKVTNAQGGTREEKVDGPQYTIMVEHFADCVLENKVPSYSGELTVKNLQAIEMCYQSLEKGVPVKR
ncbi:Gfo/Idh/MocA family protein [Pseudalkalibacillus caeni]|uniref:Gfo/Idh/MocA family oxidoreductase n=1 Tax=Exobacillus caeni TaxID=2574798 RepID=A0A5R9FA00_9BACL|nr:Gfo/Idh/MocA family oxidoreductase [Pseudalkalibacillus caeni]TLS38478.1 Gfo/Idh/MocA family oxidoreductase [Pseudalkalibacillus caeni]